jgi:DNA-binding NarL/FixJ family response regulator
MIPTKVIQKVLTTGARGYILKSDASRDLVVAVNAVLAKKTFFTAKAAQLVLDRYLGKASKVAEDESPLSDLLQTWAVP